MFIINNMSDNDVRVENSDEHEATASDVEAESNILNDWTKNNTETVETWLNESVRMLFIYEVLLEKYKKRSHIGPIISIILGSISSLLAGVGSSLVGSTLNTNSTMNWIGFGFGVIILVLNGIVVVTNFISELFKWNTKAARLSEYIEKINTFRAILHAELLLPPKIRTNAIEFIKREDDNFLKLKKNSPNIPQSDYSTASKKYRKNQCNNRDCIHTQRFMHQNRCIDLDELA